MGSISPVRIFMKRRFAGAVRAGDGVAPSGLEGGGHILEENAGAVAHGDVVDRDHCLQTGIEGLLPRMRGRGTTGRYSNRVCNNYSRAIPWLTPGVVSTVWEELETSGGLCFSLFLCFLLQARQAGFILGRQLTGSRGIRGRRRSGVRNLRNFELFFFFFFLGQGNLTSTVQCFVGEESGVRNKKTEWGKTPIGHIGSFIQDISA